MDELLLIMCAPIALGAWLAIVYRWRRSLIALLCAMPFAGLLILFSHHNPVTLVAKDILFVAPIYFGLFVLRANEVRAAPVPPWVIVMLALLAAVVLIECANTSLPNLMVAAIGAKVWLFYLPFVFVGAAYLSGPADLVRVNRLLLLVALAPAAFGMLEWALAQTMGYVRAFTMIYGAEAAADATANFGQFDLARGGTIIRIPSTFTFVTQYIGFLLAMLVPAYIAMRTDPSARWRFFATFMLYFLAVAGVLSGARQAYIFVPFLIVLMNILDGRLTGIFASMILVPIVLVVAMSGAGLDPLGVFGLTENLAGNYSNQLILNAPFAALEQFPFGAGTGMDTAAARYALPEGRSFLSVLDFNVESFYVKSIVELGAVGLIVVIGLMTTVIYETMKVRRRLAVPALRSAAAGYAAFAIVMAINSFKSWQLDQDPINVYFWLFAGFAFRLPALAPEVVRRARETLAAHPILRTAPARPGFARRSPTR